MNLAITLARLQIRVGSTVARAAAVTSVERMPTLLCDGRNIGLYEYRTLSRRSSSTFAPLHAPVRLKHVTSGLKGHLRVVRCFSKMPDDDLRRRLDEFQDLFVEVRET